MKRVAGTGPLAYLAEAADDIAYRIVDLEDAVDMGDLNPKEFEKLFTDFLKEDLKQDAYSDLAKDLDRLDEPIQKVSFLRSAAMGILAKQAVGVFCENEASIVEGAFCYKSPVPEAKAFYRPLLGEKGNAHLSLY